MSELSTMPGAWTINPSKELPQQLATFITRPMFGATIEPLALLATQLVNGMNFMLLCKISQVTNPEVSRLSRLVIHTTFTGEFSIVNQEAVIELNMLGGFELNFSFGEVPQSVATSFSELLSPLHGATYEPVAYVGNQLVNGMNHMVLAKQTMVVQRPEEHLVMVVVNESAPGKPDNEFAMVSIDRLV
jgi:hypothetical protein